MVKGYIAVGYLPIVFNVVARYLSHGIYARVSTLFKKTEKTIFERWTRSAQM